VEISVRTAKLRERQLVEELLQDYLLEFSKITEVGRNPDGSFHYPYLEYYWNDPSRLPFLIRVATDLVGFGFVRNEMDPVNGQPRSQLAEFYVVPGRRRTGIGQTAARKLWDMFPGIWTVEVMKNNTGAQAFWRNVVADYTQGIFDESDAATPQTQWAVFCFPSRSPMDILHDNQLLDF
jgi:predicted acetyltransferase